MSEYREITPECRANRGAYPAYDQAVHDLWHVYGVMLHRHPDATFVLTLARKPDATASAQADDQAEPVDTCRPVEIDGEIIRVHGAAEMSDESRAALAEVIALVREADPAASAVAAPPTDRAAGLTDAERAMLSFALDLAQDQIFYSGPEFTDEDQAAVTSLRRLAVEAHDTGVDPEQDGAPCPDCQQPNTEVRPARGDQFEAWLKMQRDQHGWQGSNERRLYDAFDRALDEYRLHADTGTLLSEHVCEGKVVGDCECLEPAPVAQQPAAEARLKACTCGPDEACGDPCDYDGAEQQPAAADGEETPVHACPGPDDNGMTPCCHRPPFEMPGDRITRDPDKVTCRGPRP